MFIFCAISFLKAVRRQIVLNAKLPNEKCLHRKFKDEFNATIICGLLGRLIPLDSWPCNLMCTMAFYQLPLTVLVIILLVIPPADGEIHRTTLKTGVPNRFSQDVASETRSVMSDPEAERTFYEVFCYSLGGAVLVGLSGIFPLLVIPIEAGPALKHGGKLSTKVTSRIISVTFCYQSNLIGCP